MNATVGLVFGCHHVGGGYFHVGAFLSRDMVFAKFLTILLFILLAIVVPIQAASLKLALRGVFREDVPFKASYVLMSIMLFVYVVIMMVAFMMRFDPTTAYIGQFFVGSFLLGRFIEINEESIGIMKASLVSLLTTAITYGIWFLGGRTIMGMLGLRMARGF